jgi:hypothetical protein
MSVSAPPVARNRVKRLELRDTWFRTVRFPWTFKGDGESRECQPSQCWLNNGPLGNEVTFPKTPGDIRETSWVRQSADVPPPQGFGRPSTSHFPALHHLRLHNTRPCDDMQCVAEAAHLVVLDVFWHGWFVPRPYAQLTQLVTSAGILPAGERRRPKTTPKHSGA